ncbi:ABC transporter substrate-binding protein [Pelomonas sp. KK5]|uniref:substrate-binding periplasmic protein n=1 Tax=Pelomonas sp. KK5 TaxID=1855730 RepID=UPI00097C4CA2|nr:transporter substrate-binding domain-containing protein [Pelomonas sp. KK5]
MSALALARRLPWLLCLLLAGIGCCCRAGPILELAALENPPMTALASAVLQPAYARLGMAFHVQPLPMRRGLQQADAGEVDGDLSRTEVSLADTHHLIRLKVPVAQVRFMAYRLGRDCPARVSLQELQSGRVAYQRGIRPIEGLLPPAALLASSNQWDALRALRRGLTAYAVLGQLEADTLLAQHGIVDVCKVPEPVLVQPLFHSLHERHAELAARLEAVLQEMQRKGEIARLWAEHQARAAGSAQRMR